MTLSRRGHRTGRSRNSRRHIVNLSRSEIDGTVRTTRDQQLAILQCRHGKRRVPGRKLARGGDDACSRIVDVNCVENRGAICATCDEHAPIRQTGGCVLLPCIQEGRRNRTEFPARRVVNFERRKRRSPRFAAGNQHAAVRQHGRRGANARRNGRRQVAPISRHRIVDFRCIGRRPIADVSTGDQDCAILESCASMAGARRGHGCDG